MVNCVMLRRIEQGAYISQLTDFVKSDSDLIDKCKVRQKEALGFLTVQFLLFVTNL